MARLFERTCKVTVDGQSFTSIRKGAGGAPGGKSTSGFRMQFRVERNIESAANQGTIQISNLKPESYGKLEGARGKPILVEGGYLDREGIIFNGWMVHSATTHDDVGSTTVIQGLDGHLQANKRVVKSFAPGFTPAKVIEEIASAMGVSAGVALTRARAGDFTGALKSFANGLTLSGNTRAEMDRIAKAAGFEWSIQSGELVIQKPTEALPTDVVLSPSTGLIGSPVKVFDMLRQSFNIVRGKTLLAPAVEPHRRIVIQSRDIVGSFKVLRASHSGDTHGDDWFTEFEAVEI